MHRSVPATLVTCVRMYADRPRMHITLLPYLCVWSSVVVYGLKYRDLLLCIAHLCIAFDLLRRTGIAHLRWAVSAS